MPPDTELSTAEVLAEATLEEAPLEEGQEQVAVATEPEAPVEPSTDWESRAKDLESQAEGLRQQFAPYAKMMADMEEAQVKELADKLASATAETPLTEQQRGDLTGLLRDAVAYRKAAPTIESEHKSLAALAYAFTIAGDDAPAKEVLAMAQELTSLGDIRLMDKYSGILKERVKERRAGARQVVATQRAGIDRIAVAPAQTGLATDINVLEAKVVAGTATPAEENRLRQAYYRRDGR